MSESLKSLSSRLKYPHTMGIFLAINAIRDAYLIMDGPSCSFNRGLMVHGRHDWASTLLSCTGYHRIQFGGVNVNTVATNYEALVRERVEEVARQPHSKVILVSSLPMCNIAGMQYDRVLRDSRGSKPAFEVPGNSLSGDWLEGYGDVLSILADGIDFSGARPDDDAVAVVGYLMERCEGDHKGNVAELERLLAGLGLRAASVWLSDRPYEHLRAARHARTIVSLPCGRRAGATLARRLGVRLIETELPFGLAATQEWLRRVGDATGRRERAEAFIEAELARVTPRLEWAVPFSFLGKRLVFLGEPNLYPGLLDIAEEVGLELAGSFLTGILGPRPAADKAPPEPKLPGPFFEPRVTDARALWAELVGGGVDMLISNSDGLSSLRPDCAWLEMGFPSIGTNALRDEPFLGFEGWLSLLHRLSNAATRPLALPAQARGADSDSLWDAVDSVASAPLAR